MGTLKLILFAALGALTATVALTGLPALGLRDVLLTVLATTAGFAAGWLLFLAFSEHIAAAVLPSVHPTDRTMEDAYRRAVDTEDRIHG